jgi:hypothetical protein
MMDLKLLNQQIKDLQKLLAKDNLSEAERISLYDTLTFLLDSRALIVMKSCKGEESDDLLN